MFCQFTRPFFLGFIAVVVLFVLNSKVVTAQIHFKWRMGPAPTRPGDGNIIPATYAKPVSGGLEANRSRNSVMASLQQVEPVGKNDASDSGSAELETGKKRFDGTDVGTRQSDEGSANEAEENQLLKSLPVADLFGGISPQSLERTVDHRVIADPVLSAVTLAYAAPEYFQLRCEPIWKTWQSPNVRYRSLHFEEENLERYGIHRGKFQPFVSGVHFFGNVIALPVKHAARHRHDCEYGLGYYRPGNCNPAYRSCIKR